MLLTQTMEDFLQDLASSSPAPGGGSVAALCGALGASLVAMVCRLTVDKPKYSQVSDQLRQVLSEAEGLRQQFAQLVERDTQVFNTVMEAFRMPKDTDDQKRQRAAAIQGATRKAAEVPLEVQALSARLLELTQVAAAKGNVNSVSDAGVAAEMACAAARSAALNVKINLGSLKDQAWVAEVEQSLLVTDNKLSSLYNNLNKMIEEKLSS